MVNTVEKSGEQTPGPATEPGAGAADTPTRLSNEHLSGSMPSQPRHNHAAVQEGTVLGDRYRVIQLLGKGGMGEVYLAEHIAIGRKVAIKTLNSANLHDKPELAGRFLREARTSSMVRHPNIVDITDFGHTPPEPPFFVMEYLEGEDLKAMLRRESTLPWERARDIVLQICAALATAHKQGVVHRDMKPDNVFLIRQGNQAEHVKVLDFGIAKITSSDTVQEATQTGVLLGTPEYMSPEQAQDFPLDARSDIYATGVILYRMLTGRVPFQSKSFMTVLARHIQEKPLAPREANPARGITEAQEAVILRCLEKRPEDRYQSAEELAEALRAVDTAPAVAVVPRPTEGAPANRWMTPVLALTALLGAGFAAWMLFIRPDPQDMPEPPATPVAEVKPEPPKEPPPVVTPPEPVKTDPPPETPPDPVPETSPTPTVAEKGEKTGKDDKKGKKTTPPTPKTTKAVASLSGADLTAAAASVSGALKECSALGIAGTTIKVDVEVGTDGKVTAATAHKPIHGSGLGNCVEKAARKARFPALTSAQKTTIALRLPSR
jgi:serine/threonine protein kinase